MNLFAKRAPIRAECGVLGTRSAGSGAGGGACQPAARSCRRAPAGSAGGRPSPQRFWGAPLCTPLHKVVTSFTKWSRAALYAASQSGHEPLYEPLHKVVTRRGGAGRCLLEARADPLAPFLVRGLLPSTSLTSQQNRAESQLNCPKRQTDPLQREQTCNKSPPSLPRRAESQLSKVN
jgi:hypothetical protein